ncbi:flagellar protein FlaG [Methylotenera sp. L2L1]|uniref:flagellar protein FlaG n=1 Tax=Methylotenera sp. L2L1 TaxID=1502770 RepID=UPI000560D818|nr:flagellar protein FlaG [Methylotenera sp. L2L1]
MFNSPLDAYGGIKMPISTQQTTDAKSVAQAANANRSALKSAETTENRTSTEANKAMLTAAVNKLNELVAPALQTVQFSMDEEAGRMIVKVIDTATQKTIRQIPNEEVLAFSKTLGRLQGLVVRERA